MSRLTPSSCMIVAALLCPISAWSDDISLPNIGTDVSTRLSAEDEKQLGAAFMRQVRQELPLIDDPEVEEYINNLGYQLVSASEYRARTFHFFVVRENVINAFAGPAGYIGVNAGLVLQTENESELAAVIGHEIAHVVQRHFDRAVQAAEKMSLPTTAAIIAAIILGSQDANLAEAAIAATLAANMQKQLDFTRGNEVEADHIGMQILAQASFDPHAMPKFFERLQQSDRLFDAQVPEFLRTHPVTTNRIAESRDRARQYVFTGTTESLLFNLTKAKLRILTSEVPDKLVKQYQAELKDGNYSHKYAQLYGYSLALLETRNYDEARTQIKKLIGLDRERIPYTIQLAKIEIAAKNIEGGIKLFEDALSLNPKNYPISAAYAKSLLDLEKPAAARALIDGLIKQRATPTLYQMHAKADEQLRELGAAHRALAEYYFLNGYTHVAIDQLTLALQQSDIDETKKESVLKRIKELKEITILEKQLL